MISSNHRIWASSGPEEAVASRGVVLDGHDANVGASSAESGENRAAFDHPHLRCMTGMKLDDEGGAAGKLGKGRSLCWEEAPRVAAGREVLATGSREKSDRLVQINNQGRGALSRGGRRRSYSASTGC
ncbi:hypothetical protein BHM03_00059695 [Ensete ventricosum]|nr:hypothetical protein BHM03_00059695 [Ensete ventricosum]